MGLFSDNPIFHHEHRSDESREKTTTMKRKSKKYDYICLMKKLQHRLAAIKAWTTMREVAS